MKNNNLKYEYSKEGNCQVQGEIIPPATETIKTELPREKKMMKSFKTKANCRSIDIFST